MYTNRIEQNALVYSDDIYQNGSDTGSKFEVYMVYPDENQVSLAFDERNLLVACTYIPDNCADDCVFGIAIESIWSNAPLSNEECERKGGTVKSNIGTGVQCDWGETYIGIIPGIESDACCREQV